jgi:hypothetical protein
MSSEANDLHSREPVQRARLLMWITLCALAVLLFYVGFRSYLNPELLFHFANSLYC